MNGFFLATKAHGREPGFAGRLRITVKKETNLTQFNLSIARRDNRDS